MIGLAILDLAKTVLGKVLPDPGQRAAATLRLAELQQAGELKELEVSMSAIIAEAQSGDKWTSRARPAFMYVFYVVLLSLAIIAPALGVFFPEHMAAFFANVSSGFSAVPEAMWWTFTTGYLGYAGARSFEKHSDNKHKKGGK